LDATTPSLSNQSDFDRTFKPFVLKKDAILAPVNWFSEAKGKQKASKSGISDLDAIIIDHEEQVELDERAKGVHEIDYDVNNISARGSSIPLSKHFAYDLMLYLEHLDLVLHDFRSSSDSTHSCRSSRPCASPCLKTSHPISVRDLMSQLTEAEVAGDISLVRHYQSKLNNHSLFPRKVIIFAEDLRPGYFGTWTRNSASIGPRSPFKKDLAVLDYGYDSGEEWEEEGEADDVIDDGEEDDGEEDPDSDMDGWLVDDEEVEDVSLPSQNGSLSPPPLDFLAPLPPKRKSNDEERKLGKKRKVVVPLVPFAKGPCWERAIDQCEQELFCPYQIQLFNGQLLPYFPDFRH